MKSSINLADIESRLNLKNVDESFYFPKYFEIETVNACNARCIMCTVDEWNKSKADKHMMSEKIFNKFADEIGNYNHWIEQVSLNRDGEPTLDRNITKKVKTLKDKGIKRVIFSTNAQLLTEELSREILEAGLDTLMISIDGIKKETYEKIRVGLNYEKVLKNTINFIKLRNSLNAKTTLRIRCVEMQENKNELDEWLEFWKKEIGDGDSAYIMPMHSWGNQLYSENKEKIRYYSNRACIAPFSAVTIHVDGTIPLCSHDFNSKHKMGNISSKSIQDIWQNEKFTLYRKHHKFSNRNRIDICQGCDIWDRSYTVEKGDKI